MAELREFLGAILVHVAHARRMADEETAAIAEYYKDHPLLEGMAVPRMRLPEVVMNIPVVIKGHASSGVSTLAPAQKVVSAVVAAFDETARDVGVGEAGILEDFKKWFEPVLKKRLEYSRPPIDAVDVPVSAEATVRAVDQTYAMAKSRFGAYRAEVPPAADKRILVELRNVARRVALETTGAPPGLDTNIETSAVKEASSSSTVTRLRIVIREEGVEWSVAGADDGSQQRTLTPE